MFKKFLFAAAASLLLLTIFPNCYFDNEEELYGNTGTCDTVAVSYATTIVPILQNNCYSCHDATNFMISGYQFDAYTQLRDYVSNGSLVARINDAGNPMPPSGLMDECLRQKIEAWVKAGAKDN